MYLRIGEDNGLSQSTEEITDDDRAAVDGGDLDIIRFRNGGFETLAVSYTDVEGEGEDEEDERQWDEDTWVKVS